jgi:hypothetical protein
MLYFHLPIHFMCVCVRIEKKKESKKGLPLPLPPRLSRGGERQARNLGAATRTDSMGEKSQL